MILYDVASGCKALLNDPSKKWVLGIAVVFAQHATLQRHAMRQFAALQRGRVAASAHS